MTGEQVIRENEIRFLRKQILKLCNGECSGFIRASIHIDNLYFDGKINDSEHDNMKKWLHEISK